MYVHSISMNTSKILDRFDLEIHEINQKVYHYQQGRHLQLKE
jgi:hypothetical protein